MIVCPVCEHPQATGSECEVCGKRFAPGALPVVPVAPMEGLEPTRQGAVELDPFSPGGRIAELEPTLAAPVDAPEERTPGLDPTRAAPVDVDSEAMPGIERHQDAIPDDAPTALPIAPVCRYCRTPAVPGERLCSRCGMRLPVIDAHLVPEGTEGVHLCTNCGSVSTRELCPACGSRRSGGLLE
jgi:hypothetical protein